MHKAVALALLAGGILLYHLRRQCSAVIQF